MTTHAVAIEICGQIGPSCRKAACSPQRNFPKPGPGCVFVESLACWSASRLSKATLEARKACDRCTKVMTNPSSTNGECGDVDGAIAVEVPDGAEDAVDCFFPSGSLTHMSHVF